MPACCKYVMKMLNSKTPSCVIFFSFVLYFVIYFVSSESISTDDIGYFWQLTDVHLDTKYDEYGDVKQFCHKSGPSNISIGKYGNYSCDSPYTLAKSAVEAMKGLQKSPDFILWTGDNGPHLPNKQFSAERLLKTIANVTQLVEANFQKTPVIPMLGNHDVYPKDILSADASQWCTKLGTTWSSFLKSKETIFRKGCYYSMSTSSGLTVVALNSVLWYSDNTATKDATDPSGQFSWLERQLAGAAKHKAKVLITGHVPMGASEVAPQKYRHLHPQFNKRLLELLRKYSDVLVGGVFAHEHSDTFRVVKGSKGEPMMSVFLAPSVTPFHLRGLGSFNPSIRLYTYQRSTHRLLDYIQYHTNLQQTDSTGAPVWTVEYRASTAYKLTSLAPTEMAKLASDLGLPAGKSHYFDRYFSYHLSGRPHDTGPCDEKCRCVNFCGITEVDMEGLDICLKKCPSRDVIEVASGDNVPTESSRAPLFLSVIFGFCIVLIFIALLVNKAFCKRSPREPRNSAAEQGYIYQRI